MKKILLVIMTLFSIVAFSQQSEEYKNFIQQAKRDAKVDRTDKTVYDLLSDFYEQVLQSDNGELEPDIQQRIQKLYDDKNAKNIQILTLFLAYQDHITQTAAAGKRPDTKFQVNLMTDIENEVMSTYGKIPTIIYVYKSEALSSDGQSKEAALVITKGLIEYPNSVPLKVYKYLDTKDERIKSDLIKNHSKHWMIKQFDIK